MSSCRKYLAFRTKAPVSIPERGFFHDRITLDPHLCGGKPTIRGLRLTVQPVLEFLAAADLAEVLESYSFLEMADIQACLRFASENLARQNFVGFAA